MATITTVYPLNLYEHDYLPDPTTVINATAVPSAIMHRLYNEIVTDLPLFAAHVGGLSATELVGSSMTTESIFTFDAHPFCKIQMPKDGSHATSKITMQLCNSNVSNLFYASNILTNSEYHKVYSYDELNSFRLTMYNSNDVNGVFFMQNGNINVKLLIVKVVNMSNQSDVKYFPIVFGADIRSQMSNTAPSTWDDNQLYTSSYTYDGVKYKFETDVADYNDGHSNAFIIKPYTVDNWMYTNIYVIEGGLVPVYNSGRLTVRYGNDDYIYLTNRFLLKITE
jgi:hypothetical protein